MRFNCCGKRFLSKIAFQEHVTNHKVTVRIKSTDNFCGTSSSREKSGKNGLVRPLSIKARQRRKDRINKDKVKRILPKRSSTTYREPNCLPKLSNTDWKQWDSALLTLLTERNNLTLSKEDKSDWDLGLETIISIRNRYVRPKSTSPLSKGISTDLANKSSKRTLVSATEHEQKLAEVNLELDMIKGKVDGCANKWKVFQSIEEHYKLMLALKTEEVLKLRGMLINTQLNTQLNI